MLIFRREKLLAELSRQVKIRPELKITLAAVFSLSNVTFCFSSIVTSHFPNQIFLLLEYYLIDSIPI